MRHELGHVIDNAFGLRRDRKRQILFGSSRQHYPVSYRPKAFSKNYVRYLGDNYAQAHPDEDFAETFAYWLDPKTNWRQRQLSPKVQEKLKYMDALMKEVAKQPSRLNNAYRVSPIENLKITLHMHYQKQRRRSDHRHFKVLDQQMTETFGHTTSRQSVSLQKFVTKHQHELRNYLLKKDHGSRFEAQLAIKILKSRAKRLDIQASTTRLKSATPSLMLQGFRYLKETNQLKHYL